MFTLRTFAGTRAHEAFLARADASYLAGGDRRGFFRPSSVLVDSSLPVHGAFRSLFQGPWSGLIIDDLFSISCESLARDQGLPFTSQSELLVREAKKAYLAEGVEGSDSKDQFGQRCFVVAGAQIDSSDPTVRSGNVLVGLPAHRRLALAHASLTVAGDRYISEELASILSGSWVTALLYRRCLMAAIGPLFGLGKKEALPGASSLRPLTSGARQDLVLLSALASAMVSNVAAPTSCEISCSDASLERGAVCSTRVPQAVAEHLEGLVHPPAGKRRGHS
eukprot:s7140_g5.t1